MTLSIDQVLTGHRGRYRLTEKVEQLGGFKAEVRSRRVIKSEFAFVAPADTEFRKKDLKRKLQQYEHVDFNQCDYILTLYDFVDSDVDEASDADEATDEVPFCLIFKWMEQNLKMTPPDPYREKSVLPKVVAKSILSALARINKEGGSVHTNLNCDSIYLSDPDGPSPLVQVGGLGKLVPEGHNKARVQSLECRAPEVWKGFGCWHVSDVWSVGVIVIFRLDNTLVKDSSKEALCIANIQRLIGPIGPPKKDSGFEEEFAMAKDLESKTYEDSETKRQLPVIRVGSLRHELENLDGQKMSPDLINFLHYLLVIDPTKRPTTNDALSHPYLDGPGSQPGPS